MKKILFVATLLSLVLVACNKKESVRVYERTAAQDIAGKYVGQWHITSTTGTDLYYDGEVEFAIWKESEANTCFIYPRCPQSNPPLNAQGLTNVAHAGDDLVYNNDKSANGIGSAFYGRVNANKEITMSTVLQGKEGRKTIMMSYEFHGVKQQ